MPVQVHNDRTAIRCSTQASKEDNRSENIFCNVWNPHIINNFHQIHSAPPLFL